MSKAGRVRPSDHCFRWWRFSEVAPAVWRTRSTDFWVAFKVFGVMPLTFIFAALQYPLLMKHDASEAKK